MSTIDWAYKTSQISTIAQIFFGGFSIVGFFIVQENFLYILLVLDTIVQAIELIFYIILVYNKRLKTYFRYFDWFFSTPLMLISFVMFLEFLSDDNLTFIRFGNMYREETTSIVLLNFVMLISGFATELKWCSKKITFPIGFSAFFAVFSLIFSLFAYKTGFGIALTIFTFVVWFLYGIAALLDEYSKNIMYNVLDIFSKNIYGVVVSGYALFV